jgi:hypothetical protein
MRAMMLAITVMAVACKFSAALRTLGVAIFACSLLGPVVLARQQSTVRQAGHVISGRVVDPLGLRPEAAVLMLGAADGDGVVSVPVPVTRDGSFVTAPLSPATYWLEMVRTPHSRTSPATVVGFSLVPVGSTDVAGVTVAIQRDTFLRGRFRMESDNRAAEWPPHIVVNAFLALDGMPLLGGTVAEGAPAGEFVLHNAFGPRVVRCGYTLAPDNRWWPTRVLLDGEDITDVPIDFSARQNASLEVVFTQHPAFFRGMITDRQGRPSGRAWIVVFAAEPSRWQEWSTMARAVQADADGGFRFESLPGRYLVAALPAAAFSSRRPTSCPTAKQMMQLAPGALSVDLAEREVKTLRLALKEP